MSLLDQILVVLKFPDLISLVTTAGLALVGLSFLSFILRQATTAANGRIGEDEETRRREEEDDR